jgi:hypothetical protein
MGCSEDKRKELRRVYRKLKGIRSQLSVKMRELKKEVSETEYGEAEEDSIQQEDPVIAPAEVNESEEGIGADRERRQTSRTRDGMQFEVKTLVDHKRRLRKRFWKLQEELRKKR